MEFLLQRGMLGIEKFNLLVKGPEEFEKHFSTFVGRTNQNRIVIPSRDYWELCRLYKKPYRNFPPKKFVRAYKTVLAPKEGSHAELPRDFPWSKVIPKGIYRKELERLVQGLYEDFGNMDLSYFFGLYKRHAAVFKSLRRAAIDFQKYEEFIADGNESSSKAILKTFVPASQHKGVYYSSKIEYDRFSSITGRLVVKEGPGILHLRKDYRQVITSQWGEDGSVYSFDFKSLEPRILLALKDDNLKTPKDLYLHVANEMGIEGVDRKLIKTVIISMIYGAGDDELIKKLKGKIDYPEDFVTAIKEQFGVEELREKLKQEYEENQGQMIFNMYKRPIFAESTPPYVLVNYFIQSTAVDVALNGFSNIIERLMKSDGLRLIRPLFVLHDALIIDVHKSVESLLPKIALAGSINIPKFESTKFWVDIEKLR